MVRFYRFLVLMLSVVILLGLTSCTQKGKILSDIKVEKSESDDNWKEYSKGKIVLKNDSTEFVFDSKTGHFTVKDLKNSTVWYSFFDTDDKEKYEESNSEIILSYYDTDSRENKMTSSINGLEKGEIRVLSNGDAIRVYYTLRLEKASPFVPAVLSGDMFKNIFDKLEASDKFKFKLMYFYYPPEAETIDVQEVRKKYPYAEKNEIYILKSNLGQSDRLALSKWIRNIGYTNEQYLNDLNQINITLDDSEAPVGYCVPIEYRLSNTGFSAKILNDKIVTLNKDYILYSVSLLPFLNSKIVTDKNGFILVPDGSGAEISLADADNASYSQRIYGNDLSCLRENTSVISKNSVLPIYGLSGKNGSMLASIESAEATAEINAVRAGATSSCAHVFAKFNLRTVDDYEARKGKSELSVLSKELSAQSPMVNFLLLPPDTDSVTMANIYRDYLLKQEKIEENPIADNMNLYLDFTGYVTTKASFLGVPYEKKVILTKLSSVIEAVQKLNEKGIKNIFVRLSGISDGGKYHSLLDDFSLDKNVGSFEELRKLADLLCENGGGLYIENNFFEVYKDTLFDSFVASKDAIRRLDKTQGYISNHDLVSLEDNKRINTRYLISPAKYNSLSQSFVDGFNKKTDSDNIYISCAKAGEMIISDFDDVYTYDRTQTQKAISDIMKKYSEKGSFMTDVGNMYSLKYAEHILNVPASDSNYSITTASVPFFQTVAKGCVSLAGEPMNISGNEERTLYEALLFGTNPYWSCVTESDALSKLKGSQSLMPTSIDSALDEISDFFENNKELYDIFRNDTVISYKTIKSGIVSVAFSGGKQVFYNQTENDIEIKNSVIKPFGYVIEEG